MKFEQWWEALSEPERRVMGKATARFIWLAGFHTGFEEGYIKSQDLGEVSADS